MSNKTYDFLKWFVMIVMPALSTLIGTIGTAVQWEQTEITLIVLGAVTTFLGVILGVSNNQYKRGGE